MLEHYALIQRLTAKTSNWDQERQVNDFAAELGWRPSDRLQLPASAEFSTGHLIVEHGLEYTAVISFLLHPYRFIDLNPTQQKVLVGASYNNLIDWNISVDYETVSFVYSRYRPPEFHVVRENLSKVNTSVLQRANFRRITSKHPVPDVPPLDQAVIETISIWKRQLVGERPNVSNAALSALFNAILFVRAAEDHKRNGTDLSASSLLLDIASSRETSGAAHIREIIRVAMERLEIKGIPAGLIELDALRVFDDMDDSFTSELLEDFYRNRFARYFEYDFSRMSKHALSRIYEHYVSILRTTPTDQSSFWPRLAETTSERGYGNVYTPEFIARFFARYLRTQLPLRTFQRLEVVDPACGSGVFLRAFLELQNEVLWGTRTTESIRNSFENITGVDVDPNACHAARLSLSLLSLVLLGEFPERLRIITDDFLSYYFQNKSPNQSADVVVANPPYVSFEAQTIEMRSRIGLVLGKDASGKPDLYLAALKIALRLLRPGGYGLFVLPETFLKSDSASGIRELLGKEAWIECVVDLTSIKVFDDVGVYTILLIFQKKSPSTFPNRRPKVVRCQGDVPQALQAVLDDQVVSAGLFTIHEADEVAFSGAEWSLDPPNVSMLLRKYSQLATLEEECTLRQGMNTGADDAFVIEKESLSNLEEECFAPLLVDRDMEAFTVPVTTTKLVFYPFIKGRPLDETTLARKFRATWAHLKEHREQLTNRSAVKRGTLP